MPMFQYHFLYNQAKTKGLMGTDNSMVIAGGRVWVEVEVEEGVRGDNNNGKIQ